MASSSSTTRIRVTRPSCRRRTTTVAPPPGVSSSSTLPPMASVKPRTMARPSPTPVPWSVVPLERLEQPLAVDGGQARARGRRPAGRRCLPPRRPRCAPGCRRASRRSALSTRFADDPLEQRGVGSTPGQAQGHVHVHGVAVAAQATPAPRPRRPRGPPAGRRRRARRPGSGSCRAGWRPAGRAGRSRSRSSRGTRAAWPRGPRHVGLAQAADRRLDARRAACGGRGRRPGAARSAGRWPPPAARPGRPRPGGGAPRRAVSIWPTRAASTRSSAASSRPTGQRDGQVAVDAASDLGVLGPRRRIVPRRRPRPANRRRGVAGVRRCACRRWCGGGPRDGAAHPARSTSRPARPGPRTRVGTARKASRRRPTRSTSTQTMAAATAYTVRATSCSGSPMVKVCSGSVK